MCLFLCLISCSFHVDLSTCGDWRLFLHAGGKLLHAGGKTVDSYIHKYLLEPSYTFSSASLSTIVTSTCQDMQILIISHGRSPLSQHVGSTVVSFLFTFCFFSMQSMQVINSVSAQELINLPVWRWWLGESFSLWFFATIALVPWLVLP